MSSDILKSEILPNVKVDKESPASKVPSDEVKKEGVSLFDSILSKTKSKVTLSKEVTSQSKQNTIVEKKEVNSAKILENIKVEPSKVSLLDRMASNLKADSPLDKTKKDIKPEVDNKTLFDKLTTNKIQIDTKKDDIPKEGIKNQEFEKLNLKIEKPDIGKLKTEDNSAEKKIVIPAKKVEIKETQNSNIIEKNISKADIEKLNKLSKKEDNKIFIDDLVNSINSIKSEDIVNDKNNKKPISNQKEKKISLLDSLVEQTKVKTQAEDIPSDKKVLEHSKEKIDETPLQAKIFLSNQRVQKEILSGQKIVEAKEMLNSKEKSVSNIKKSADTLELNSSKIEIVEEESLTDKKDIKIVGTKTDIKEQLKQQNNMLNKIFLNQTKGSETITLLKEVEIKNDKKSVEVKSVKENAIKVDEDIKVTVEQTVAQSITTKIVESKQKMNSFMSDVAKNIYLNYKPPITAFRIRLDPANLGSIAIMMKSDKANNSISVSLNMSQSSTLETFSENRGTLQNALNKVFDTESTFSLDFGMQDSDNSSFEQFNQQQNSNQSNSQNSSEDINIKNEEEIVEDQSYM